MKVRYSYTEGKQPIYVDYTEGTMRVLLVLIDDLECFVYYCSDYHRKVYINKLINPFHSTPFFLKNFEKIKDDEKFESVRKFIHNNFNYDGIHITEKITGVDQGGPIFWSP